MAVTPPDEVPFDEDDMGAVVAAMGELTDRAQGWINFVPEVEPGEEVPPRNLLAVIFSARGEPVPMATWTAPEQLGGRASIGIQHGRGPRALARLAEAGLPLRTGWLKVADHARRGVVVTVPADEDREEVLWWLLSATHALSVPPLTGDWLARIYRP